MPRPSCPTAAPFYRLFHRQTGAGAATLWRHRGTGAAFLHIAPPLSAEPVFAASFPTAVHDNRGLAHLVEHLIFRGLPDQGAEPLYPALMSARMISFLNASTQPDYTTFHLATPKGADLAEIAGILLKAIFDPGMEAFAFAQEIGTKAHPGILPNEMRDHLALRDTALALALRQDLLAGQTGAFNQGGTPEGLLSLTLSEAQAFHHAHFHPGSAHLALWSDVLPAGWFDALDAALSGADRPRPGDPAPPIRQGSVAAALAPGAARHGLGWRLPAKTAPEIQALLTAVLFDPAAAQPLGLVGPATGLHRDLPQPLLTFATATALNATQVIGRLHELATPLPKVQLMRGLHLAQSQAASREAFPRRPEGLLQFDRMMGAWLRQGPEAALAWLDLGARLHALAEDPGAAGQALSALIGQSVARVAPHALHWPEQAIRPQPPLTPRASSLVFRPLPAAAGDLPHLGVPLPAPDQIAGGVVLQTPPDPLARLAIGFQLDGLTGAQLSALPPLAAALRRKIATHSGLAGLGALASVDFAMLGQGAEPGAGLAIHLAVIPALLPRLLAALPPLLQASPPDPAPGLADLQAAMGRQIAGSSVPMLERRLQARLSPGHGLLDRLVGPGVMGLQETDVTISDIWKILKHPTRIHLAASHQTPGLDSLHRDLSEDGAGGPASPVPPADLMPDPGLGDGFATNGPLHSLGLGVRLSQPLVARAAFVALEAEYYWPLLRGAGGAYGVRLRIDGGGRGILLTARDPHLLQSLDRLRTGGAWLGRHADAAMVARCRQGAAAQVLTPPSPQLAMVMALGRSLAGPSAWPDPQADLAALRALRPRDLRLLAQELDAALQAAPAVVFAPAAQLTAAEAESPGYLSPAGRA